MARNFRHVVWCTLLILLASGLPAVSGDSLNTDQQPLLSSGAADTTQTFTLKHVFHHDLKSSDQRLASFADVATIRQDRARWSTQALSQKHAVKIQQFARPRPQNASVRASLDRDAVPVSVPNVTDRETIVNLATMASDVYWLNASNPSWRNVSQGFVDSPPFGYDGDGLRGHVFANSDNSIAVVAFKGTSLWLWPGEPTSTKDCLNDNLLFSCCCASQAKRLLPYRPVCSCGGSVYHCNAACLAAEIRQPDRYYAAASSVVYNVTQDLFPSADVWVIGHSLGGSLASLVGLTFDLPVVTFEAPPERLAAQRLGLVPLDSGTAVPKNSFPAFHIGHNGDPIYMGACNGYLSSCTLTGFVFESQCFTGKRCIYDMQKEKRWSLSIYNHGIDGVIDQVLTKYDPPECVDEDPECVDCFNWKFD